MTYDSALSRRVKFWNGENPQYDASILMTTYMARDTLVEALSSVFDQKTAPGTKIQMVVGVDPSTDGTLELAMDLAAKSPEWLTVQVFANELPGVTIGGRKTARSNFMNCYARLRGRVVLFLNCDDAWRTNTKLQSQIDHVRTTGRACGTRLETEALPLREANETAEVLDPFIHGTTIQISSFAMPYFPIKSKRLWWTVAFLDLPIMCHCWDRFGIDRLTEEVTFYRISSGGAWSSMDYYRKYVLIRDAVVRMVVLGPYSLRNKRNLWIWMKGHQRWAEDLRQAER